MQLQYDHQIKSGLQSQPFALIHSKKKKKIKQNQAMKRKKSVQHQWRQNWGKWRQRQDPRIKLVFLLPTLTGVFELIKMSSVKWAHLAARASQEFGSLSWSLVGCSGASHACTAWCAPLLTLMLRKGQSYRAALPSLGNVSVGPKWVPGERCLSTASFIMDPERKNMGSS